MMQDSNLPAPADSMVGKLLVASTLVDDPVLHRAVCLVVHQDMENVFGVLLNRPMSPNPALTQMLGGPNPSPGNNRIADSFDQGSEDDNDFAVVESDVGPPSETTAEQAMSAIGTIHFGGPLSGPVVAVHDNSEHAEASAGKGVYVAAQRELLENIVREKSGSYRLIVGHLGWSRDQLRGEYEAGYWHIIDATEEDVFTVDQELWSSVIRRATSNSVAKWLGIPDVPMACEVN